MRLTFQLRSVNVDASLPHKTRAEEIEELPQYMEVVSLASPDLALLNIGEQEPGGDQAAMPWLKTNASGEPLGLFVNVGGAWVPATEKQYVRHQNDNVIIRSGTLTVTLTAAANAWNDFGPFTLFEGDNEFDDIPQIWLAPLSGSLLEENQAALIMRPTEITKTGFRIRVCSGVNCSTASKILTIQWEAKGVKLP